MGESIKIFVVEDDPIVLESYKSILSTQGFTIVGTAMDGAKAIKKILASDADLILTDINLPSLNGLEVIKEVYKTREIPCVFITGYYSEELIKEANSIGAFGYIIKPISDKQLLAAIDIARQRYSEFESLKKEARDTREALEARKHIEIAKGILMRRTGVDEMTAMKQLQQKSKNKNKKLVDIAKEIIAADKLLS